MTFETRLPPISPLPIGFDRRIDVPASLVAPVLSPAQVKATRAVARAVRVRNAQDKAVNAPFNDIAKEKFSARVCAERSDAQPRALGLVTNETKDRRVGESIRVNVEAQRIKRMKCSVGHAARLLHFDAHCEREAQRWNLKFLTLTYADADGWEPGHFGAFRKTMNHWMRSRGIRFRYVWVAELQKRGALHYHIVIWLPKGKFLPKVDSQGWWPHGSTNIVTAQSPIGYITKYASKTTQDSLHGFPKGARMCGHGGLPDEGRRHIRYWQAPIWVRDALSGRADIRKVPGGYCDKLTGEYLVSPWRVTVTPGGQVWAYRIDQSPETIQ